MNSWRVYSVSALSICVVAAGILVFLVAHGQVPAVPMPSVCFAQCFASQEAKEAAECANWCYAEEDPVDASFAAMCEELAHHELKTTYMYRDTNTSDCGGGGIITVGIGNALCSVNDALNLPFVVDDGQGGTRPATEQEIRDAFNNLPRQPGGCSLVTPSACYGHGHFENSNNIRLTDEAIDELCQQRIENDFFPDLLDLYPDFHSYPTKVQMALYDMIYNLGRGCNNRPSCKPGLEFGFPNFNRAIRNRNWQEAAAQSNRVGPSDDRNRYVRELLEAAAREEEEARQRLLLQCNQTPSP